MRLFVSLRYISKVIQKQFSSRYTPMLHRALECVRVYTRTRPLTLDERIAEILDLADTSKGMFDFVLLQLHRQAVLNTLIRTDLAATAPIHNSKLVMSTSHTREIGKPDLTINVDQEHRHLVPPLFLLNINTSAPTTIGIDSIPETVLKSLTRHQKGRNYDPNRENPVLPLVSGNHPFDLGGHLHIYPTPSHLPSEAPYFPPLTHDTPRRELMGSWGQRPCQPGFSCSNTTTARGTGNARPQSVRIACCRAKMAPNPPTRGTPALQVARRTTPTTSSTPTGPYDTPTKEECLSLLTQYSSSLFRYFLPLSVIFHIGIDKPSGGVLDIMTAPSEHIFQKVVQNLR